MPVTPNIKSKKNHHVSHQKIFNIPILGIPIKIPNIQDIALYDKNMAVSQNHQDLAFYHKTKMNIALSNDHTSFIFIFSGRDKRLRKRIPDKMILIVSSKHETAKNINRFICDNTLPSASISHNMLDINTKVTTTIDLSNIPLKSGENMSYDMQNLFEELKHILKSTPEIVKETEYNIQPLKSIEYDSNISKVNSLVEYSKNDSEENNICCGYFKMRKNVVFHWLQIKRTNTRKGNERVKFMPEPQDQMKVPLSLNLSIFFTKYFIEGKRIFIKEFPLKSDNDSVDTHFTKDNDNLVSLETYRNEEDGRSLCIQVPEKSDKNTIETYLTERKIDVVVLETYPNVKEDQLLLCIQSPINSDKDFSETSFTEAKNNLASLVTWRNEKEEERSCIQFQKPDKDTIGTDIAEENIDLVLLEIYPNAEEHKSAETLCIQETTDVIKLDLAETCLIEERNICVRKSSESVDLITNENYSNEDESINTENCNNDSIETFHKTIEDNRPKRIKEDRNINAVNSLDEINLLSNKLHVIEDIRKLTYKLIYDIIENYLKTKAHDTCIKEPDKVTLVSIETCFQMTAIFYEKLQKKSKTVSLNKSFWLLRNISQGYLITTLLKNCEIPSLMAMRETFFIIVTNRTLDIHVDIHFELSNRTGIYFDTTVLEDKCSLEFTQWNDEHSHILDSSKFDFYIFKYNAYNKAAFGSNYDYECTINSSYFESMSTLKNSVIEERTIKITEFDSETLFERHSIMSTETFMRASVATITLSIDEVLSDAQLCLKQCLAFTDVSMPPNIQEIILRQAKTFLTKLFEDSSALKFLGIHNMNHHRFDESIFEGITLNEFTNKISKILSQFTPKIHIMSTLLKHLGLN